MKINRPKSLNAFSRSLFNQLERCIDTAATDPNVRVIVISATGKAFSVGLDLKDATSGQDSILSGTTPTDVARAIIRGRAHIHRVQSSISALERCEKPVICVLHGYCIGAAIDLASAADIRLCTDDAKFCVKEVDIGIAADVGTLQRFPRVAANQSWARRVVYTAEEFSGSDAYQHGFVSSVFPTQSAAVDEALKLADVIAQKSPVAIQGSKHLLNYSRDHSVREGAPLDFATTQKTNNFYRTRIQCIMERRYTAHCRCQGSHPIILHQAETIVRQAVVT